MLPFRWARALAGAPAVACCLTLVAALVAPSPAAASSRCGPRGYAYAGMLGGGSVYGIGTVLTALATPVVEAGHVAGWVGVGGPGEGPGGSDEWIQVGLNSNPGSGNKLYYEVARPGAPITYFEVNPDVAPGVSHRVAVLEMIGRTGFWRVWVDGAPVSDPVNLPGSHGRLTPMAIGESWDGGAEVCNRYVYSFRRIVVATWPGGAWRRPSVTHFIQDQGYHVVRRESGFVALTQAPREPAQPPPPAVSAPASAPAAPSLGGVAGNQQP